jgi:predicted nucleic acid-binding protein
MIERANSSLVYVDSNPFIYMVEGEPKIARPLKLLFDELHRYPGTAITSELTLAEVLAPDSFGTPRTPDTKRMYLDLVIWSHSVALRPVSREVLLETTKVRSVSKLKLPDAIHLCTAILNDCDFFLSRDRRIKPPEGMTLIEPSEAGIAGLIEAIR